MNDAPDDADFPPGYWASLVMEPEVSHARKPRAKPSRLPLIRVLGGFRHRAADAGLEALAAAGCPFFQRDGQMVRVRVVPAKACDGAVIDVPAVAPVPLSLLGRALGMAAEWQRLETDEEDQNPIKAAPKPVRCDPPKEVVEQIAAMAGEWPFPPLAGIIGTQTMRPDGSLLTEPGYDLPTGLYLAAPPPLPPVPETPTLEDAQDALATLGSLLAEFPFADAASESAGMSMLLTAVLRGALPPAVPMHVVQAPESGSGKSYLADIASVLATGERCAVVTVAPEQKETESRLIGAALAGYPIIAIDNCNGVLTGDFLAQVTERPLLQIRPLGTSTIFRITNTFTVFANGNNIAVAADLVRRTVLVTLDADMEHPEERKFAGNPIAELQANRGKYIAAALTIARGYLAAGSPNRPVPTPSYERWSDLVRGSLIWLGWADPASSAAVLRAEDPVRAARKALFGAWSRELQVGIGYQTAELIRLASEHSGDGWVRGDLRAAFLAVAKSRVGDQIDTLRLARWLIAAARVVTDGYKLTVERSDPSRPRWQLVGAHH